MNKLLKVNKNILTVCQMRSTNNKQDNRQQIIKLLEESKKQQSSFVFFPECCDYVGTDPNNTKELSEGIMGETMRFYQQLAQTYKMWLSIGGFHEAYFNDDGVKNEKMSNSHVIINDLGDIVTIYRKLHLFDVDTPDFKFRESQLIDCGKEIIKPIDTPIGILGLMICYDLRFPELSSILRQQGAHILTYPSAFSYSTGKAHWETLLKARAIENQCYVVASAQIGFHNTKRQSYGHAMVVDPAGRIIAKCDENELCAVSAEIKMDYLIGFRQLTELSDVKNDGIYTLVDLTKKELDGLNELFELRSEYCRVFKSSKISADHSIIIPNHKVNYIDQLSSDALIDFIDTIQKAQEYLQENNKSLQDVPPAIEKILLGKNTLIDSAHCYIKLKELEKGDCEVDK